MMIPIIDERIILSNKKLIGCTNVVSLRAEEKIYLMASTFFRYRS